MSAPNRLDPPDNDPRVNVASDGKQYIGTRHWFADGKLHLEFVDGELPEPRITEEPEHDANPETPTGTG